MKIRCIDKGTTSGLTLGKVYNVISKENDSRDWFYIVENDHGLEEGCYAHRFEVVGEEEKEKMKEVETNKYTREIRPHVFCDVYDVIKAFAVNDPCLQHAIKKLLAAGERGHKDRLEDLEDIVKSVNRAIEMHKEWSDTK